MTRVIKCSIFLVIFAIAAAGCKKDNDNDNDNKPSGMQKVELTGRVTDAAGNPVSGVSVSTGTLKATTGSNGEFSFDRAQVVNKRAVIQFEKSGYFKLTRSGVKENEMYIEAVMTKKGNTAISLQTSFNESSAKSLEIGRMKVALSASSVTRADGSAYSGNVNADMLYLDPNNENFAGMMPGGDLAGIRADNSESMLVSYGMTDVVFTDDAGNPLQLKDGSPAGVTFPIPEGMENNPPATIPLWSFDEEKGIWIEEGVATLQGDVYVGTVTHFSWVNLDDPKKRVTIRGKVKDCDDEPVPYVQVKIGQTASFTNSKGEYSAFVPENTPVTASVSANGGSDSKNVPGRPGDTTYDAPDLKVPCPEEGEHGTGENVEKASVKYLIGHESDEMSGVLFYYVFTFDNDGKRQRADYIMPDDDEEMLAMSEIVDHIAKTHWLYYAALGWMDETYSASDNISLFVYKYAEKDLSGYTKLPNRTYAGKSCSVYSISLPAMNYTYTLAIWNGLVLFWEISMAGEFTQVWVAQSVTLDVPDVAFTKTTDITWIE